MKSTEIEAERVVSSSGLLTGRPNISWPHRGSASLQKATIETFCSPSMMYERKPPLRLHPSLNTSPLPTPTLTICGAHCTQCNSHADARRTDTYIRSAAVSVLGCSTEQGLSPLGTGPLSEPWCGSRLRCHQVDIGRNYHRTKSAQACVSPHRICGKDSKLHPLFRGAFTALFITPSLSGCLHLYRIIKPISHRTIKGHRRQGRF